MESRQFVAYLGRIFSKNGFMQKGQRFYRNFGNLSLAFALQRTAYGGEYYYMEYGFFFPDICPYAPYPRFNELDINCGRVMLPNDGQVKQALEYKLLNKDDLAFEQALQKYINRTVCAAQGGIDSIVKTFVLNEDEEQHRCLGYICDRALPFLGITREQVAMSVYFGD